MKLKLVMYSERRHLLRKTYRILYKQVTSGLATVTKKTPKNYNYRKIQ